MTQLGLLLVVLVVALDATGASPTKTPPSVPIPMWVGECHRLLEQPSTLPMQLKPLRDGSVRTGVLALATELAGLEWKTGIPHREIPLDEEMKTSNYEHALGILGLQWAKIYGAYYPRTDDYAKSVTVILESWFKDYASLGDIVSADTRLYFDKDSGLFLIGLQNGGKRSKNFRADRTGKVFDVTIENGLFHSASGPLHGKYIFAWNRQRELRVTVDGNGLFHDDIFLNEDLAMAGEFTFDQGVPELLSDQSGHFRPPQVLMEQFLEWLKLQKVKPKKVEQMAPG